MKRFIVVFLLCCISIAHAEMRLLPEDEAERDLSLLKFRQLIKKAVTAKDADALLALLDKKVSISSNKKGGIKRFKEYWQPDSPDSELWPTLQTIINMGGGFVRSERGVKFCAPYVFTNFPSQLDIYGHGAIINDNVPLKQGPTIASRSITNLSYNIVKVEDWRSVADTTNNTIRWLKIRMMDGIEGYVEKNMIRSPSDYSACFLHRSSTGWKIISLIGNE